MTTPSYHRPHPPPPPPRNGDDRSTFYTLALQQALSQAQGGAGLSNNDQQALQLRVNPLLAGTMRPVSPTTTAAGRESDTSGSSRRRNSVVVSPQTNQHQLRSTMKGLLSQTLPLPPSAAVNHTTSAGDTDTGAATEAQRDSTGRRASSVAAPNAAAQLAALSQTLGALGLGSLLDSGGVNGTTDAGTDVSAPTASRMIARQQPRSKVERGRGGRNRSRSRDDIDDDEGDSSSDGNSHSSGGTSSSSESRSPRPGARGRRKGGRNHSQQKGRRVSAGSVGHRGRVGKSQAALSATKSSRKK